MSDSQRPSASLPSISDCGSWRQSVGQWNIVSPPYIRLVPMLVVSVCRSPLYQTGANVGSQHLRYCMIGFIVYLYVDHNYIYMEIVMDEDNLNPQNFIDYLLQNQKGVKKIIARYEKNPYKLRQDMAEDGFELTPDELKLIIKALRDTID